MKDSFKRYLLLIKDKFKILTVLFVLFLSLSGLLFAQRLSSKKQSFVKKAAEEVFERKSPERAEYRAGEVIVKFKSEIPAIAVKKTLTEKEISFDKQALLYSSLEENNLPTILRETNRRYPIKQIEKIFKGTESPEKEVAKLKTRFASEIAAGKKKINEQELLKIDLSRTYKISFGGNISVEQVIKEITLSPEVEYAELNYIFKTQLASDDPYYLDHYPNNIGNRDPNWNPPYDYQWNLKKINMEQAWDISTGSAEIKVAVIDTGVDYTHPELGGCTLTQVNSGSCEFVSQGFDFVNNDNDPIDDMGHGTHVAGLIVGPTNNNQGVAFVNWRGKIVPVKVLDAYGTGTTLTVSQGIIFASNNGARVINISLGNRDPFAPIPKILKDALDFAYYQNIVLVAASGNSRQKYPSCPLGFWPADYRFVIEVAASKEDDSPASYSNCSKDVAAPGGENSNIISLASSLIDWNPEYLIGSRYTRKAGTSMAAPHVSALTALILSLHPNYQNEEIRTILKIGADSMWNSTFGAGRINAYKTLIQNVPKIAFLTKPAENDNLSGLIQIEGIFKNISINSPLRYISVAPGFYNTSHDPSFQPRDDGINLTYPQSSDYQGLLATWDTDSYRDGIYTIWFHTNEGAEDFLHINLFKGMVAGWPVTMVGRGINLQHQHPFFSDINGDGKKEIITGSSDGYIHIIDSSGKNVSGWPKYIGGKMAGGLGSQGITSNPAVADIDGDGKKEIIASNSFSESSGSTSWPKTAVYVLRLNGENFSSAWPKTLTEREGSFYNQDSLTMVEDIDKDGQFEIIISDNRSRIHALKINGEELAGWPVQLQYGLTRIRGAVGNVFGDEKKEIVIVENDWNVYSSSPAIVHVLDSGGRELQGWPKTMTFESGNQTIESPPTLVDLDGDGFLEIMIVTGIRDYSVYQTNGRIVAWKGSGEDVAGWPVTNLCGGNPLEGQGNPTFAQVAVGRVLPGGGWGIVIETSRWRVCFYDFRGVFQKKIDLPNEASAYYLNYPTGIALSDLNSDGVQEIVVGSNFQKLYALDFYGNSLGGFPKMMSVVSNPFISDINNDGFFEIGAVGSLDSWANPSVWGYNSIYIWRTSVPAVSNFTDWPMWDYDERHTGAYILPVTPTPTLTPTPLPTNTPQPTPTPVIIPHKLTVTFPNWEPDIIKTGNTATIRWTFTYQGNLQLPLRTSILLQKAIGAKRQTILIIANKTASTGQRINSYQWNVPNTLSPGKYRIKVRIDKPFWNGTAYFYPIDESDRDFSIVSP